ncbi:MAG: tRNA (N6-threonylcarbamoyladenosine(37)-N6)-methyltransferase TrmO [Lachnospiraceae bacterium]|nr:tRNA (N6-threonylcarbamoyladenosine(37)-N6)-methyltransferase TrmO [Lachnospiraceae bacterium]
MPESYEFRPIAHIYTGFPEKFGIPRQSLLVPDAEGRIVFEPEFRHPDILRGIEGFDYLWISFVFSENVRTKWNATVTPPRLGGRERKGVFATRSPFRPNPIGLSCVKLEGVTCEEKYGNVIRVSGVDMLDGTPILDIKPYIAYADAHPEARAGFAAEVRDEMEVIIPPEMEEEIPEGDRRAVYDLLKQDPRTAFIHDEGRVWGVSYKNMNIKFTAKDRVITVCGIEKPFT